MIAMVYRPIKYRHQCFPNSACVCGQGGGGPNHECGDQITSVLGLSGGAYIPSKVGLLGPISLVIWGRGGGGPKYREAHFTTTPVVL